MATAGEGEASLSLDAVSVIKVRVAQRVHRVRHGPRRADGEEAEPQEQVAPPERTGARAAQREARRDHAERAGQNDEAADEEAPGIGRGGPGARADGGR